MNDVSGEPQLILVNGEHVASVLLLKGTNSGPLPGPGGAVLPATNKKFGVLIAHSHRLGKRVEEPEHHLDLLERELLTQMGAARGLEAALTRIQRYTCLPVDPDVWPSG